jgi:hypothetical protein
MSSVALSVIGVFAVTTLSSLVESVGDVSAPHFPQSIFSTLSLDGTCLASNEESVIECHNLINAVVETKINKIDFFNVTSIVTKINDASYDDDDQRMKNHEIYFSGLRHFIHDDRVCSHDQLFSLNPIWLNVKSLAILGEVRKEKEIFYLLALF